MAKKVEGNNPGFVEEYVTKPYFDADGVQVASGIGLDGKEYPDPVPVAPPVGYTDLPDLMTTIRRMVHNELFSNVLRSNELETFEEAEDFEVDDDADFPLTDYERVFDPSDKAPPGPQAPASGGPPVAAPASPAASQQGGSAGPSNVGEAPAAAPSGPPLVPSSTVRPT